MAFSTSDPLDDLFRKLQRGELSRRAFMRRASALGIGAAAAAFMAQAAGTAAQDATPGASPVAGGGGAVTDQQRIFTIVPDFFHCQASYRPILRRMDCE